MAQSWRSWDWKLGLASSLAMGGAIANSWDCALAQNITLDGSLGPAQTLTGPNYSIPQAVGQTVDSNLFHSFGQFGLNTGESAIFESAANIRNILSRVTGGSRSFIDGLIDTQSSSVNLFLLNPSGIDFGGNARLDVGGVDRGSFVATTFDALVWPNGGQFSATNPGGPSSLLTLVGDPSGFLSSLRPPQSIGSSGSNLQVFRGQSLLLLGGNVSLDGGSLQAPGGRVELGGVAGAGTVGLSIDSQILSLSFPDGVARADVSLTNGAGVNVRAGGGGSIAVNARNLNILAGSQLRAGIEPNLVGSVDSKAGNVEINATEAITINGVRNGTPTDTGVFHRVGRGAVGKGGDINITTGSLSGSNRAQLRNSTEGQGDAGSVTITARDTVSFDGVGRNGANTGVFARVEESGVGKGGDINITTGSLAVINDARLSSSTFGRGDGGNVIIQARDTVSFDGDPNRPRFNPNGSRNFDGGGVFSQVGFPGQTSIAEGNGGDINITTGSLSVTNGNFLSTATRGRGNAGNVRIVATDTVSFDKVGSNGVSTGAFSNVEPRSVGNGGGIDITARSISVTNGSSLNTNTSGQGNAGNVKLVATDTVSFDGVASNGVSSGAESQVRTNAVGNGGSVEIATGSLFVTNGARLSARSEGNGAAGNIEVSASSIRLDNQAALRADTIGGQGNITVDSQDLVLRRGSNITTNAQGTATGGNINIDTGVIAGLENSDITANAFGGQGGIIDISAQGIFGLVQRELEELRTLLGTDNPNSLNPARLPTSDITAISQTDPSLRGQVTINNPDVDPSQGLIELPAELVDVSNQIATDCPASVRRGESKFIITGRGGLPPNPREPLNGDNVLTDWNTLDSDTENRSSTAPSTSSTRESAPNQIVEAQGWVINNKGEVILTATAPTATLQIPWVPDSKCHTPEPES